jgi:hypothetical protein
MKIITCAFLFFWTFCAYTQEQTLLSDNISHGVYCAPLLSFKTFGANNNVGISPGFQIGWIINEKLTIGAQVHQLWNNIEVDWTPSEEPLFLNFAYSGFRVSYIHLPHDLLHFEIYALYGVGLAGYRRQEFGDFDNVQDDFQIIEPGVLIETNLTHFMRLGVDIAYDFIHGIELVDMTNADFTGMVWGASIKVGIY